MTNAVIRVGDGRGFIVKDEGEARLERDKRIVVTAAHCLPFVPPCDGFNVSEGRTYEELLGPLGQESTVPWVETLQCSAYPTTRSFMTNATLMKRWCTASHRCA
jgi:hypothetical protein